MSVLKRILLSALISEVFSVTLGLLFAVIISEDRSAGDLLLPGVIPTTLLACTIVAAAITPVAVWSVRTGARNLWLYGPILWIVLAVYIVFAIPRVGHYGPYGLLSLAVLGLLVLGFVPAR